MKKAMQKKGLEPDCCFYIQNEAAIRGVDELDFEAHPPPDLVVEVGCVAGTASSSGSLDKFPIYGLLKVPEIWRLRRGVLTIYLLNEAETDYGSSEVSLAFAQMPVRELPVFLQRAKVVGQRSAVRELAEQARQALQA